MPLKDTLFLTDADATFRMLRTLKFLSLWADFNDELSFSLLSPFCWYYFSPVFFYFKLKNGGIFYYSPIVPYLFVSSRRNSGFLISKGGRSNLAEDRSNFLSRYAEEARFVWGFRGGIWDFFLFYAGSSYLPDPISLIFSGSKSNYEIRSCSKWPNKSQSTNKGNFLNEQVMYLSFTDDCCVCASSVLNIDFDWSISRNLSFSW